MTTITNNSLVSMREARIVIANRLADAARQTAMICHDDLPAGCHVYLTNDEPCWWFELPSDDCRVLRSRRLIAVGKETGKIHYDGSAGDEG